MCVCSFLPTSPLRIRTCIPLTYRRSSTDPMAIARAKAEEIARKLKQREAAAQAQQQQAPQAPAPVSVPQVAAASLQAAALQEQIRRQMEQVYFFLCIWGGKGICVYMCLYMCIRV